MSRRSLLAVVLAAILAAMSAGPAHAGEVFGVRGDGVSATFAGTAADGREVSAQVWANDFQYRFTEGGSGTTRDRDDCASILQVEELSLDPGGAAPVLRRRTWVFVDVATLSVESGGDGAVLAGEGVAQVTECLVTAEGEVPLGARTSTGQVRLVWQALDDAAAGRTLDHEKGDGYNVLLYDRGYERPASVTGSIVAEGRDLLGGIVGQGTIFKATFSGVVTFGGGR